MIDETNYKIILTKAKEALADAGLSQYNEAIDYVISGYVESLAEAEYFSQSLQRANARAEQLSIDKIHLSDRVAELESQIKELSK